MKKETVYIVAVQPIRGLRREYEQFDVSMDAPDYLPVGSVRQVFEYIGTSNTLARYTFVSTVKRAA